MANTKHVKKTLACSVLALTASVTAFVGTTFAWFTDSESAGQNTIVTGNLDVQFWHCPNYQSQWGFGYDAAGATQITGDTALFLNKEGKPMLWEPGAGTGETFRVKNVGTLALKYRFRIAAINATQTAEGNDLTDILSMQITELDPIPGMANEVPGQCTAEDAVYHEGYFGEGYVIEHTLLPGETDDFNVAIDWYPSIRDNEFNVTGGLELTFVVDLLATQTTHEIDSGDDQYDKDADYDGEISNVTSLEAAFRAGGTYKLISDIDANKTFTVAEGAEVTLDLNGKSITRGSIVNNGKLTIDGTEIGATYSLRRAAVGNVINAAITNNGELAVDGVVVNAAIANSGKMAMENVTVGAAITNSGTATMNGSTINATVTNNDDLTISGTTFNVVDGYGIENTGDVTVESGNFMGLGGIRSKAGDVTINSGNFYCSSNYKEGTYQHALKVENGKATINGGNFDATIFGQTNAMLNASTNSEIVINGGTFKNVQTLGNFDPYIFTYEANGKATINGGSFFGGWRFNGDTATTDIYGGDFTVSFDGQSFATHTLTVYGGSFTPNTAYPNSSLAGKVADCLAEGMVSVDNKDGTFTVLPELTTEDGSTEGAKLEGVAGYAGLYTDGTNYYVYTAQGLISMNKFWADNHYGNNMWGRSYNIMADIDATGYTWNNVWVNVGSNENDGFVFDGHDHTITGLKINGGLFSGTPNGVNKPENPGYMQNITFDGVEVVGDHFVAVLWSNVYNELVVENVTVKNSTITGKCNVAALVGGTVIDGAPDASVTFKNCVVENNTITATGKNGQDPNGAAAFISRAYGTTTLTFEECVSEDNTISNSNGLIGGGIYGYTVWANGGFAGTGSCDDFINWNGLIYDNATFKAAIKAGKTEISLVDNNYTMPSVNGVTITISGSKNVFMTLPKKACNANASTITFDGITVVGHNVEDDWYTEQLDDAVKVTYKNCTVKGLITGYCNSDFINCVFENDFKDEYSVYCYSGDTYNFEGCTFNTACSKAIKIYDEGSSEVNGRTVNVTNCKFFASSFDKAAVEIDSTQKGKYFVIIENCEINEYYSKLWNDKGTNSYVTVDGEWASSAYVMAAIKNASATETIEIELGNCNIVGNIDITLAAIGEQKGDIIFKAKEGCTPVIAGTVTVGLYENRTTNVAAWVANVTFVGITFDHALNENHSINVQNFGKEELGKKLTLQNCTIIGDGEYGIGSVSGCLAYNSRITGCTFENAGMQITGNFGTGLVIDGCTFNNSRINVQGGTGVTVQNCNFTDTVTNANNNESFYLIRSNAIPITVTGCKFNVDSTVDGVGVAGLKGWGVFVNRGTADWTVTDCEINLTEKALAQTALIVANCLSTGKINMTNVTVNGEQV